MNILANNAVTQVTSNLNAKSDDLNSRLGSGLIYRLCVFYGKDCNACFG